MTTITIDRATVEQALEALTVAWQQNPRWQITEGMHALRAALAQQAEPDHETRAELAEQQVVQLAEERDHYRNLWQKAQQAEPAKTFLITGNEFCGAPPAPYATWGDALAGMLDAGKIEGLRISALAQQDAAVKAERERIFAHIRSAMGHAEAGYDNVAWRLLAWLVGPNVPSSAPMASKSKHD